jgi:hypothetical protein
VSYQAIEAHCPRVDDIGKGHQELRKLLSEAKVVLSTLNVAGSSLLRDALGGKFNTLFIDEAAQVSLFMHVVSIPIVFQTLELCVIKSIC